MFGANVGSVIEDYFIVCCIKIEFSTPPDTTQNQSQQMTEFEHSEKFICCTHDYIKLVQPEIHNTDFSNETPPYILNKIPSIIIPTDYHYLDHYVLGIGYKNNILMIILYNNKHKYKYGVMKFDAKLKLLSQYYIDTNGSFRYVNELLNEEMLGCNFGPKSVFNKYKSKLPHNIKRHYFDCPDGELSDMCYDQYEDTIVLTFGDDMGHDLHNRCKKIEVWKKTNKWKLIKSKQTNIEEKINTLYRPRISILRLECSRKHIVMGLGIGNLDCSRNYVVLLDKFTFELVSYFLSQYPTYYDDYDDWTRDSIKLLCGMACLGQMSEALLKIILSYAS